MPAFSSSSSRKGLQGPRPPPLRIERSSIPTLKPRSSSASSSSSSSSSSSRQHSPIVVHVLSPKVVHTSPQEFMSTVQRLTGKSSPPNPLQGRPPEEAVVATASAAYDATPMAVEKTEELRGPPILYQFLI